MVISKDFEGSLKEFTEGRNPDVSKGIDLGIKIEKMGIEFYDKAAEKSDGAKHMFKFLAGQEREHLALLNNLKSVLVRNGDWTKPSMLNNKPPKIFKNDKKTNYEISAILDALEREKMSEKFYENFSKRIKDAKGKKFFKKMAEFERRHIELLSGLADFGGFRMQS
jgi:rubrerythrin